MFWQLLPVCAASRRDTE